MRHMIVGLMTGWLAVQASAAGLQWMTDLPAAKKKAKTENKIVLLDFTGSDWCILCKQLSKEVLSTDEFAAYASAHLVLVEVDFPVGKAQSPALKKANEALQDKYKVEAYPTLIALNTQGKQIWKHEGVIEGGPKAFIAALEAKTGKKK